MIHEMSASLKPETVIVSEPERMMLPVMEEFFSIQGEGYHTGVPASFIRLAGCDVGCVWCDVKESWEVDSHSRRSVGDIIQNALCNPSDIVIITGGEPALHDLNGLTSCLRGYGKKVHLETSGTRQLTGSFDWITVSPKKFKPPLDEVLGSADELKVVVYDRSDLAWALSFLPMLKKECILYLQPEYSKRDVMTKHILEFIGDHPQWKISLQIHKTLGVQ